jgi:hypothetical protein
MTRVTRLKEARRIFWRNNGMKPDAGIRLQRISGIAASRSLRRETKSGAGTRTTPSRSTQEAE